MRKAFILSFILAFSILIVSAKRKQKDQQEEKESNGQQQQQVSQINQENAEQMKKSSKYVIVLITDSDRASMKLIREYPQILNNFTQNTISDYKLAIVNNTAFKQFAKNEGVKKIPSLILYSNNGVQKDIYKGLNYVEDMRNWLIKIIKSPRTNSKVIENFTQLADRVKTFDMFITFFGTTSDTPEFKFYEQFAGKRKDFIFTHTFDKECREENGYRDPELQGLVLYSRKEEQLNLKYINHYRGDLLDQNEIKQFLKVFSIPSMSLVRAWETKNIFSSENNLPNLVLGINSADYYEKRDNAEEYMAPEELVFMDLRPQLQNKVFLQILNITERNRGEIQKSFELDANYTIPIVFLVEPVPNKPERKYVFQGKEITEKSIIQFVNDFKKGKLVAISSSEAPYPQEKQDKLIVKSVVKQNWEQYVSKNFKQDVLVFFYTIGSSPCDEVKEMYYKLAHRFRNNKYLLFTRINIGDNDIDGVIIKRVPEMKLYPANRKDSPINFIYSTKPNQIIDALKQGVHFQWVQPLNESEIDPNDIEIDQTDKEIYYNTVTKKEMEAENKRQSEQYEREQEESRKKQEEEAQKAEEQQEQSNQNTKTNDEEKVEGKTEL